MTKTEWYYQLDGDDLLPKNSVDDIILTIKNNPDALLSFLNWWRYAFYLIALFAFGGLSLSIFTKFTNEESK